MFPPSPQLDDVTLPHADFDKKGAASAPSDVVSLTAALLFRILNIWTSGSRTYLSLNRKLFLKLTSSWFKRGVSTDPGGTNWMVSEAWPSTVPVGKTLAPGVQPTQFFG